MLLALLCALALAPLFAFAVPGRFRREVLLAASLVGLAILDPRLPVLVLAVAGGVHAVVRGLGAGRGPKPGLVVVPGLALLVALFVFNKLGAGGLGAANEGLLPSQGGLVLLGVSYLVLKAAAALVDAWRGALRDASFFDVLAWIAFLPVYTSGPIEELDHFRNQRPSPNLPDALAGLERILFGLVKTMLLSHYLGLWSAPILQEPAGESAWVLLLAVQATTLRIYFDFAGYSDIAIGVSALFGIRIQENFDNPLVRRNITLLWQRWHMTLTRWLRVYLFVPISRRLLRRGGDRLETAAIGVAHAVTMTFCGLWHGLGWNFVLWGVLQAAGMLWVAAPARTLGARLPAGLRGFWRDSRAGYGLSALVTFHYFAFTNILFFTGIEGATRFVAALLA